VICDATGIPLAVTLTGGNRNDVTQLMPLLQAVPPIRGKRGRPRQRPRELYADRGYDHDCYRRQVWAKGIKPVIARRGTDHGSGLGTKRWVVEQTIALLHWFGRLRIRWEIRDDIHEAFLKLACSLVCWRRLRAAHSVRSSTSYRAAPPRVGDPTLRHAGGPEDRSAHGAITARGCARLRQGIRTPRWHRRPCAGGQGLGTGGLACCGVAYSRAARRAGHGE
jgi:hypothetical protein